MSGLVYSLSRTYDNKKIELLRLSTIANIVTAVIVLAIGTTLAVKKAPIVRQAVTEKIAKKKSTEG